MHLPLADRLAIRLLIALTLVGALSAFTGAAVAIVANGTGIPQEYLANSPLRSYAGPGLILGLIVGGTQLAAATALARRQRTALLLSTIAGFGMLIWIFLELAILRQYSWLQPAYIALDAVEPVLVLALLGIRPKLVVPLRKSDVAAPRTPAI